MTALTASRQLCRSLAVNTASRMESNGVQGKIHCSQSSKELLETVGYVFADRGEIPVKGKGTMHTFWLTGIPPSTARVVRRAVDAAKAALEQLVLDRAGAETSSDDDGAGRAKKEKRVPLWDRGRRHSRGMYIDEDDKNRTQVLRQAIETGLKKSASGLAMETGMQDVEVNETEPNGDPQRPTCACVHWRVRRHCVVSI